MWLSSLLLTAILLTTSATAQFVAGTDPNSSPSVLCNKTFADANATGIFSFTPGIVQGDQEGQPGNDANYALDASWGVTVWDNIGASNATAELSAWYSTNNANYSDNANLWYDVCVITMNTLTTNTYYRAVNDKGDCLETLDTACADALEEQAAGFAYGLVSNPTPEPGSNLTAGSLGHVCYDVGNMMTEEFPQECNKFFNGSAQVYGTGMTSANESWIYSGCTVTDDDTNSTFQYVTGTSAFTSAFSEELQKIVYANFTQVTIPVLTVFLPIADINAGQKIATANAALSCPHVNHINPGSLEPYAAPSPTPIGGSSSLSGGAIAGIVIGALAGVAIIAGAVWFFWFRKRRASIKATNGQDDHAPPAYSHDAKVAESPHAHDSDQTRLTELSGYDSQIRPELPTQKSGPRVELPGDVAYNGGTGRPPVELSAGGKSYSG